MDRDLKELFREAARLPQNDRATLAGLLIESLDPAPEADVEAAWSREIARRIADLDAGRVETIPWEEVRVELFGQRDEGQTPSGGS
jgi:putative addiction module component (TIGR02574 family)